jgi:hypothetical protein
MSGLNKKKNLLFNSKWRGSEVGDSPVKEHIRVHEHGAIEGIGSLPLSLSLSLSLNLLWLSYSYLRRDSLLKKLQALCLFALRNGSSGRGAVRKGKKSHGSGSVMCRLLTAWKRR